MSSVKFIQKIVTEKRGKVREKKGAMVEDVGTKLVPNLVKFSYLLIVVL